MMGSRADMGEVMGQLFADASSARIGTSDTAKLSTEIPPGAKVDKGTNTITFTGHNVAYAVVASPAGADDRFETAGLVDSTVQVPAGARVSIQLVNADRTSAQGLMLVTPGSSPSWMPMGTARIAFEKV